MRQPRIKALTEADPREGFVEPAVFERIVAALPSYVQDAARFTYLVGWRKGAVRGLTWADVDRAARRLVLRRATSKNKKPYAIALTTDLAAIVERRWAARSVTRRDGTTALCEYVFHREGRPIGDFRKSWATACTAAGMSGLIFHDLRRSAAMNMERAGVSSTVGMRVTGHATLSMWTRYRIVGDSDVEQALARVEGHNREAAREGARRGTR